MTDNSKRKLIISIIVIFSFIFILTAVLGIAYSLLFYKTKQTDDDYMYIYSDSKYHSVLKIENFEVIKQNVSCGYAVIEMFSRWSGGYVTESNLYSEYGKVVTSTGESFCKEFNRCFPEYETTMCEYLKNSELIDKVYKTLAKGIPVPFEWAAKLGDKWTLIYSIVIGIDIANDIITIANPYGYIEEITIKEFIDRTSFRVVDKMPFSYSLGFAFGIFEKNTIFIPDAESIERLPEIEVF